MNPTSIEPTQFSAIMAIANAQKNPHAVFRVSDKVFLQAYLDKLVQMNIGCTALSEGNLFNQLTVNEIYLIDIADIVISR